VHATNSIDEEGKTQSKEGGTSTNASVEEGASNSNKTNSYRGASNNGDMTASFNVEPGGGNAPNAPNAGDHFLWQNLP
jgi:hypothetical protein